MIRHLLLFLMFLAIPLAAGDPPASTWTMPEAQRQAIRDLADRVAVAAGIPDVRQGRWHAGPINWAAKRGAHAASDATKIQPCTQVPGIHALLSDGSWMIAFQLHLSATHWDIDSRETHPVNPAEAFILDDDAMQSALARWQWLVEDSRFTPNLRPCGRMRCAISMARSGWHPCIRIAAGIHSPCIPCRTRCRHHPHPFGDRACHRTSPARRRPGNHDPGAGPAGTATGTKFLSRRHRPRIASPFLTPSVPRP